MKCLRSFYLFFILCSISGFSQEKFTNHTVKKGETVSGIAKKYNIDQKAIYELNPDASKGLGVNSILIIPNTTAAKSVSVESFQNQAEDIQHKVFPKETLFSIAKKYKVKVQDLYAINPNLEKEGLKNGQVINITKSNSIVAKTYEKGNTSESKNNSEDVITTKTEGIDYEVLPKETKYSIAKTYGISVERLEKANPILQTEELKIGQKLIIPVKPYNPNVVVAPKEEVKVIETPKTVPVIAVKKPEVEKAKDLITIEDKRVVANNTQKQSEISTPTVEGIDYEVLPKETKYSIAKSYGISVDRLEKANPILLSEELKIGQKIIIPVKPYNPNTVVAATQKTDVKIVESPKAEPVVEVKKIITEKIAETPQVSKTVALENSQKQFEKKESVIEGIDYVVLPKETIYSIAKQNGITVTDLYKLNPNLVKEGLESGKTIKIIQKNSAKVVINEAIEYKVLPKESLFSIAKKKGVSVDDLKKANPVLLSHTLKSGQIITIPGQNGTNSSMVNNEKELKTDKESNDSNQLKNNVVSSSNDSENKNESNEYTHEVISKETKYGIAKEYGITVKELEKQNPKIVNRLSVGSVLTIRSGKILKQENTNKELVVEDSNKDTNYKKTFQDADFLDQLIETASENIGTRYRSGGTTKEGFDCSGLMCTTFGTYDIQLPRTSIEQSHIGVVVNKEEAKKGDLIFFKTSRGNQINHVGMVVEVADGDIKFIHASNSGVIISSIKEKYYVKRFTQINRVL